MSYFVKNIFICNDYYYHYYYHLVLLKLYHSIFSIIIFDRFEDHIKNGSTPGFEGGYISFTSELNVALAWGGCLSPIAVVDIAELKSGSYCRFDKEYLRRGIEDKTAKSYSRRAHEVLVGSEIKTTQYCILKVEINSCERILSKGFEEIDNDNFPTNEEIRNMFQNDKNYSYIKKQIGGSNKRIFKIIINNKNYIIHTPRPNYSLDNDQLFDEELTDLGYHNFVQFTAYRIFDEKHIPKCAYYTVHLSYNYKDKLQGR